MKAQEMADKIKQDPTFKGLDIWVDERRGAVDVNGFHSTPDSKATKAKLENLGFKCGPNFGSYEGETPERKKVTPKKISEADWDRMVKGQ